MKKFIITRSFMRVSYDELVYQYTSLFIQRPKADLDKVLFIVVFRRYQKSDRCCTERRGASKQFGNFDPSPASVSNGPYEVAVRDLIEYLEVPEARYRLFGKFGEKKAYTWSRKFLRLF